jgi:hypothetical protein
MLVTSVQAAGESTDVVSDFTHGMCPFYGTLVVDEIKSVNMFYLILLCRSKGPLKGFRSLKGVGTWCFWKSYASEEKK